MNIAQVRREYTKTKLNKNNVHPDPIVQFNKWLNEALESNCMEPTAMTISTVSENCAPSSRVVLLKGVEDNRFVFYTNYNSRKGIQLRKNPNISALFFWSELERQIIIEGTVEKTSTEKSDEYFGSRPWKSRIGAIISPQSQPIESRNVIKKAFVVEAARHIGDSIPRPPHWGGYMIDPNRIEFWQGRPNRLHDRVLYLKDKSSVWNISRLAP
ncbi:MAG: pyridoxamine 5'-phosphate oxidase [Cytophagales bacterium]|nr:pyridoxamine 5'-phosphate oxidase [Cytophagales bacterium]